MKGRVDLTSPGKRARVIKPGDDVNIGDIIRAKSKSRAEIIFNDGNVLRLAEKTRLEITEYLVGKKESKGIFNLFRGKVQNIIKKSAGKLFGIKKRNRFEVHTPTAVVGVRGTNFFTYYQAGITGSVFKEG